MISITDLTYETRLRLIEAEVETLGLGDDHEVIVKYLLGKARELGHKEGYSEGYDEGHKEGYAKGECADPLGRDRQEYLRGRFGGGEW